MKESPVRIVQSYVLKLLCECNQCVGTKLDRKEAFKEAFKGEESEPHESTRFEEEQLIFISTIAQVEAHGEEEEKEQLIHALAVSLSYFIYDSICCLFDSSISLPNCIHHLVSVLGLGGGVMYAKSGSELIGCLWLMEISNPFMHMRELLKELGYKDSSLSIINDVCFALVFTFARLIIGPYIVYVTVTADNPLIIKGPMERLLLPSGPVQLLNCKNENRQKIALHRNVGAATAWEDDFPRWVVMWG
ncbi:hypothetical protein KI387_005560 [Taxus chinensis]|uniref:TLC domain-containing protein n=1 Tax=Taxus chinensis TaxID=29808 RepID=A0AA38GNW3_TAXCH|nr:hypothetical protein KI387_005560 [Taxus chinensis]